MLKSDLAAAATTILGRVTDRDAIALVGPHPLVQALGSPNRRVRFAAARALALDSLNVDGLLARGFLLIEVLVAVSIFALAVLALGQSIENVIAAQVLKNLKVKVEDFMKRAFAGAALAWIGLLPISVTFPVNVSPGSASMRMRRTSRSLPRSMPVRTDVTFSQEAMRRLMAYDWPGNIRELKNAIERAAVVTDGEVVTLASLPPPIRPAGVGLVAGVASAQWDGPGTLSLEQAVSKLTMMPAVVHGLADRGVIVVDDLEALLDEFGLLPGESGSVGGTLRYCVKKKPAPPGPRVAKLRDTAPPPAPERS